MRQKLTALLLGAAIATPALLFLFNFMNSPQCPDDFTKHEIEASNCVIGANIGLPLFILIAPIIWTAIVFGVYQFMLARAHKKQTNKEPQGSS